MDEIIEDALIEVNKIRAVANLQPIMQMPKGLALGAGYCPIARALSELDACVGDEILYLTIDDEDLYKKMYEFFFGESPINYQRRLELIVVPAMKTFIHKFDCGRFPDLMDEMPIDTREE